MRVKLVVGAAVLAFGAWLALRSRPAPAAPLTSSTELYSAPVIVHPPEVDRAEIAPWPHLNPDANLVKAWRLAEGPHRAEGDHRRLVTLTFDDGPSPETTPRILDLLARHKVHATFFVIGRYLDGDGDRQKASRDVLQKVVAAGHLVGNHTHDHQLLTAISHTQVLDQIDHGAESIERAIGKKPMLFRPPFGELDDFGQEAVRERGLDVLLWSIEAQDMERNDTTEMVHDLEKQLVYNEGGIVLHDMHASTVTILRKLLTRLDARRYDPARPGREGYEIVDLPTYLREVEASPPVPGARASRR